MFAYIQWVLYFFTHSFLLAPVFLKGDNMSEAMFELIYTIDSLLRIVFMIMISAASIKYLIKRSNNDSNN